MSREVDDLLYDGEAVVETVPVDDGRVVVTTHRLLAWTPAGEGRRLRSVARPNVASVSEAREGGERAFGVALRAGVVGVVCLVVAPLAAVDVPDVSGGEAALGGGLDALASLFGALALLDEALTVAGALALAVAAAAAGWFLRRRERVVRVDVAGEDDVSVRADDPASAARGIEAALR